MSKSFIKNQNLFSQHYLSTRLHDENEWQMDPSNIRKQLADLFNDESLLLEKQSEGAQEQKLIEVVLELLDWKYQRQYLFRTYNKKTQKPDYALFSSPEQEVSALDGNVEHVTAFLEVKSWDKPLSGKGPGAQAEAQIIGYLGNSGLKWGMLTNGRLWRLYFYNPPESRQTLYYEVDLPAILNADAPDEAFKWFYLFFRKAAFDPDRGGKSFLERLRRSSRHYASRVEDSLKDRVFDSIVPIIGKGFIEHLNTKGKAVGPEDRETLDLIYSATLLLLYRLLFLLYAEARELISVGDNTLNYNSYSLNRLKKEIYEKLRDGSRFSSKRTNNWSKLKNLFQMIDQGDEQLNVPRYNGGLFSPDGLGDPDIQPAAEFLEANALSDYYVAEALMQLTREGVDGYDRPNFIDFRDLGVRHLGSVYEGLLEFQLEIADSCLMKAAEKGKLVWKSTVDPEAADISPGDLYLINDKAERKATGSYYTPDYIVNYIVENTVGPQIDRIERECELAREIRSSDGSGADGNRTWAELLDEVLEFRPPECPEITRKWFTGASSNSHRKEILLNILDGAGPAHDYDPPLRVLELNVLDPALGSGHFLVGALDYMLDRLRRMQEHYGDSPVYAQIEEDREKVVTSLKAQGIVIEGEDEQLDDENMLRRMVLKRCLYGVDVNPLAVELTKLSLWLHAFTAGAPLSFLDHHIKCGNSLVGASLSDLEEAEAVQVSEAGVIKNLWRVETDFERAIGHLWTVAELSDASFEDVERSRKAYCQAEKNMDGYRAMLNCLIAEDFGVEKASYFIKHGRGFNPEDYENSIENLSSADKERLMRAEKEAAQRRFFHWDVEFPEVFYEKRNGGIDRIQNGGFDIVIGNPPYGSVNDSDTQNFLNNNYEYVQYRPEHYVAFMQHSFELLAYSGYSGLIVPDNWMYLDFTERLRIFLLVNSSLQKLVALPSTVFSEATVDTCVYVLRKVGESSSRSTQTLITPYHKKASIDKIDDQRGYYREQSFHLNTQGHIINPYLMPQEADILSTIYKYALKVRDLVTVNYGLKAYQKGKGQPPQDAKTVKKRPFTAKEREEVSFLPFFKGKSIGQYSLLWNQDSWIKWGPWLAEPRSEPLFSNERLLFRKVVGKRLIGIFYDEKAFSNTLLYILQRRTKSNHNLKGLLAVLNSHLLGFIYRKIFAIQEHDIFPQILLDDLASLPIRRFFFTTPQSERAPAAKELIKQYENNAFKDILGHVESCLPRDENGEFAAFTDSITMAEALKRRYVDDIPDYLPPDSPSGYDAAGRPLERSDVVHDLLAHLAGRMQEMNTEKQEIQDALMNDFKNVGINPDDLSSLSVTKGVLNMVEKARKKRQKTEKLSRVVTYANELEGAFGCTISELYGADRHNYGLDDLSRLGFERVKWAAALRHEANSGGARPEMMDKVKKLAAGKMEKLTALLRRIGAEDGYPCRHAETGEYDVDNVVSTDWLIDQIVYRIYGLTEDEIKMVEETG